MPKAKSEDDGYFDKLAAATEDGAEGTWLDRDYSGQLAVDVFETPRTFVIHAAIAGVTADDIDITVNNDMVTIKGMRQVENESNEGAYLYQECYWGGFSRTIILPLPVKSDQVKASLKNGILRVTLPKAAEQRPEAVRVVDEEESK
jgi:HSP20 family protein